MTITRQRELRRNSTPAEKAMWNLLRQFKSHGCHFRREVALGLYFADFADHRAKIVVEVDGESHAVGKGPEHDRVRTEYLESRGFRVLRFTNGEVLNNPEGVYQELEQNLGASQVLTPTPNPSPQGGGEQVAQRDYHPKGIVEQAHSRSESSGK